MQICDCKTPKSDGSKNPSCLACGHWIDKPDPQLLQQCAKALLKVGRLTPLDAKKRRNFYRF